MSPGPTEKLVVRGANEHNLQAVSCELPRNQLVVITGPSGSGKSSLAFDTIYAEGQRRYVESLSTYARQFLDQLPKPDVESIDGLSPAIAIEQKALGKSPRSTVGTVTEILDYLRLMFARIGVPHCPRSGKVLRAYTVQEIVDTVLALEVGSKVALLAPLVRGQSGDLAAELEALRRDGFVRARIDGNIVDLGDPLQLVPAALHDLDVVVDRIVVREGIKGRVTDSVELALKRGNGTLLIDRLDGSAATVMSERLVSWEYGISLPPLEPRLFSFNSPHGACPSCNGIGLRWRVDPLRVIGDPARSLRQGAVAAFGRRGSVVTGTEVALAVERLGLDPDMAWQDLPETQRAALLYGKTGKNGTVYEGIVPRLERLLESGETDDPGESGAEEGAIGPEDLGRFVVTQVCEACAGSRLRSEALSVRIGNRHIAELCSDPLRELRAFLTALLNAGDLSSAERAVAEPLIKAVVTRLGFLIEVGLDYLTLDRSVQTLSGGEGQRIRLATQIGAALVGVLYVLDEPSVGLHARDNARLLEALRRLVDKGNSVLMVEHDRDAILAADYLVDMGPGAGTLGGTIVAQGTPQNVLRDPNSVTAPYLNGEKLLPLPKQRNRPSGPSLRLENARAHNLKNVSVEIPLGLITAVTGVSGSGKSSLIVDTLLSAARATLYGATAWVGPCDGILGLEHIDKVISIDQAAIGKTPRSNPATYTGIFTQLRELFAALPDARARGYKTGRFSFNVKGGRCETCQGDGVLKVEMHFLPDVYVKCDSCGGQRYGRETLEIKYRGYSIADILDLTVDQASDQFSAIPKISQRLAALRRVGLGYVKLGQPATTLSGGEAQRVKLASELSRTATGRTLYVLDEPTTGLHFSDIDLLTLALFELRDQGNSIVVVEHNLDLIACADWVIDMGPEGGAHGGNVVATGSPEQIAEHSGSHTGRYLKGTLAAQQRAPTPQAGAARQDRLGANSRTRANFTDERLLSAAEPPLGTSAAIQPVTRKLPASSGAKARSTGNSQNSNTPGRAKAGGQKAEAGKKVRAQQSPLQESPLQQPPVQQAPLGAMSLRQREARIQKESPSQKESQKAGPTRKPSVTGSQPKSRSTRS